MADELKKLEGIFSSGYGIAARMVMEDPDLSAESKAIYIYYCITANNNGGPQDMPREQSILTTLQISHTRYIKHRKILQEKGLIRILPQQMITIPGDKTKYGPSQYILVKSNVYSTNDSTDDSNVLQDGLLSRGYGLIPRLIYFDRSIPIEAKTVYAYLCCCANASIVSDRVADPIMAMMVRHLMSPERIRKSLVKLVDAGYVTRKQGSNHRVQYTLVFDVASKVSENKTTENKTTEINTTENKTAEINTKENKTTDNDTAFRNTKVNNTNTNINHVLPCTCAHDAIKEYQNRRDQIAAQLEIDVLKQGCDAVACDIYDAIVSIMTDIVGNPSGVISINGVKTPRAAVAVEYRKLRAAHAEHVQQQILLYGHDVSNMRAYITTCLYNAAITIVQDNIPYG